MATIEASATGGLWSATAAWTGAKVPTEADDVILGTSSGSITVAAESKCRSLDCNAYKATLKLEAALQIGTSTSNGGLALRFGAAMTLTPGSNNIRFVSTSGTIEKITTAGKVPFTLVFKGIGGKWQFEDKVSLSQVIALEAGTLNTNGQELVISRLETLGANAIVLELGASLVKCSNTEFAWELKNTNITIVPGTSTIELTGAAGTRKRFEGAGKTYHNVIIAHEDLIITGSNTFANLTLNCAGTNTVQVEKGTTQTITESLTTNAVSGKVMKMESTEAAKAWKLTKANGVISLNFVELKDSTAEGGAEWYAGENSVSISGNTGWIFKAPITTKIFGAHSAVKAACLTNARYAVPVGAKAASVVSSNAAGAVAIAINPHTASTTACSAHAGVTVAIGIRAKIASTSGSSLRGSLAIGINTQTIFSGRVVDNTHEILSAATGVTVRCKGALSISYGAGATAHVITQSKASSTGACSIAASSAVRVSARPTFSVSVALNATCVVSTTTVIAPLEMAVALHMSTGAKSQDTAALHYTASAQCGGAAQVRFIATSQITFLRQPGVPGWSVTKQPGRIVFEKGERTKLLTTSSTLKTSPTLETGLAPSTGGGSPGHSGDIDAGDISMPKLGKFIPSNPGGAK